MERKKALPRGMRPFLLVIQHLALAIAACGLIAILTNLGVKDSSTGEERYYAATPFDEAQVFEDSTEMFLPIFRDHLGDVITKVVIGSQLGEDGSYNGKSVVDITSYANRKDLAYDGSEITAYYRLEDLLKWYRSGLEYEAVTFTSVEELEAVFGDSTFARETQTLKREAEWISEVLGRLGFSHNIYIENDQMYVDVYFIKEKYLSADGVSLLESAPGWEAYSILSSSLYTAVDDLGYNFSLYNSVKDSVLKENTNLRYYFEVEEESGSITIYTNDAEAVREPDAYFKGLGRYASYDTEDLSFESNIVGFVETAFREKLERYEYVFGESSRLYIGVDTSYPVNDVYKQARSSFWATQDMWVYVGLISVCLIIWIFLLIFLSVMAGRVRKTEGRVVLEAGWFDHIPTEIMVALGIIIIAVFIGLFSVFFIYPEEYIHEIVFGTNNAMLQNISILVVILASMIFTQFWYSLVRRLKMGTLLTNSLCFLLLRGIGRGCKKIYAAIRRLVIRINENLSTVGRFALQFIFLAVINLGFGSIGLIGFFQYFNDYPWRGYLLVGFLMTAIVLDADCLYGYYVLRSSVQRRKIVEGIVRIREGEMDYQLDTTGMYGDNRRLAEAVNSIGFGIKKAVETSMKDERLKADLITNVSHDIKTPLTSIINYVDLLKRENIQEEPVKGYIEVLDAKSQRLKQLTDDLVEASKISSGNIVLNMEMIDLEELLKQAVGEFSEKFEKRQLAVVENYAAEPQIIRADSRRMWRVIENLFNNIYKYAMEGTRIYIDTVHNPYGGRGQIILSVKNISASPLNISPDELTERFIRGDESRTTEGSGLGLSIAKSLTEAQGGHLNIVLDGDLFKVVLVFESAAQ